METIPPLLPVIEEEGYFKSELRMEKGFEHLDDRVNKFKVSRLCVIDPKPIGVEPTLGWQDCIHECTGERNPIILIDNSSPSGFRELREAVNLRGSEIYKILKENKYVIPEHFLKFDTMMKGKKKNGVEEESKKNKGGGCWMCKTFCTWFCTPSPF